VGSPDSAVCAARLSSAWHKALAALITQRLLREDLYFRLSPIKVELPPLRDRAGDLFLLFDRLIAEAAQRCGRARAPDIAPETLEALRRYRWPGNVRELQNEVQRVIALTDPGRPIVPTDLSPEIQAAAR